MPFQPDSLSGIFLWFKSTSVTGVTDGGSCLTWSDSSGSGHNLTLNGGTPTYQTNVVNGYPVVRFNGSASLKSSTFVGFTARDLTLFSVFKTNSSTDNQSICSHDNNIGSATNSAFIQGLNFNGGSRSGFYFSYGDGGLHSVTTLVASSTQYAFQVCPVSTFMVRHDRFRTDNALSFGRYGVETATGIASTAVNSLNNFKIGASTFGGNLNGDVAEIIAYNRRLSDSDVQTVDQYLMSKYVLGSTSQFTLFIQGDTAPTSYISGIKPLYVGSSTTGSKISTLYLRAIPTHTGTFPLYTHGPTSISGGISIVISGITSRTSGNFPLYMGVTQSTYSMISMSISGTMHLTPTGIKLFTQSAYQQYPPIKLYEGGFSSGTKSSTMFLAGGLSASMSRPIFINALASQNSPQMTLFTKNLFASTTGQTTLFLQSSFSPGNHSGIYTSRQLYLEGGKYRLSMPLYLSAEPINTHPSESMTLFVQSPVHTGTINHSTTMFVQNTVLDEERAKKLFIRGDGTLDGGLISSGGMPLYLNIPFGKFMSLFIRGSGESSRGVNLYSRGVLNTSKNTTLYLSGRSTSGNFTMFIHGPTESSGGKSMYVKGLPQSTDSITSYIHGF